VIEKITQWNLQQKKNNKIYLVGRNFWAILLVTEPQRQNIACNTLNCLSNIIIFKFVLYGYE
jgi:hypothetical protein